MPFWRNATTACFSTTTASSAPACTQLQYHSGLQKLALAQNIRNLSFKRHRLDGQTKPAGRIVLYFDAVLRTAQQIGVHRRGTKAGKCADAYLMSAVLRLPKIGSSVVCKKNIALLNVVFVSNVNVAGFANSL